MLHEPVFYTPKSDWLNGNIYRMMASYNRQQELISLPQGMYLLECLVCSKIPTVNRIHQCENGHIGTNHLFL